MAVHNSCKLLYCFSILFCLIFFGVHAQAAITFVAETSDDGNDDKAELRVPGATSANDLMLVQVVIRNANGSDGVSSPAGWNIIGSQQVDGNVLQSLYYKVATGSDAGTEYEWDFDGNRNRRYILGMVVFRGVDTNSPIDDSNVQTAMFFSWVTAPSVTTSQDDAMLVAFYSLEAGDQFFTPPFGMTEAYDEEENNNNNGLTAMVAYSEQNAAGFTGNKLAQASVFNDRAIGHLVALSNDTGSGGGGSCVTFRDEFSTESYSRQDGTVLWSSDWIETDDNNNASNGDIQIDGGQLRLEGDRSRSRRGRPSPSIEREADLSGYSSATLSFNYRETGSWEGDDFIYVEVSSDGGSSWSRIQTYQNDQGSGSQLFSMDISAFIASNFKVRFVEDADSSSEIFYFDNVQVEACGSTATATLIAEYRFDELSWGGVTAEVEDSSGNSFDGAALQTSNGVNTMADGFICRSAEFPDISNNISYAVDTSLDINDDIGTSGAISIWHRSNTDWTNTGSDKTLWDASSAGGDNKYFYLVLLADGRLRVGAEDSFDGDYRIQTASPLTIAAGEWANIVVNWDINGVDKGEIWVNGARQAVVDIEDTLNGSIMGNTYTLYIGDNRSSYYFDGSNRSADGDIDEVLVFDSVLGGMAISNIINLQSSGQNLDGSTRACPFVAVAQYHFEENVWAGVNGEVLDESGNNLNGTAVNGTNTAFTTPDPAITGDPGTCRYGDFPGGSEYVIVADNNLLDISSTLTVAVWVYPREFPSSGLHTIVSKDENYEFHLTGNGQINWWWNDSNGATRQITTNGPPLTLNTWQHVAIVYRSGNQSIYINGIEQAASSFSGDLRINDDSLFIGTDLNFIPSRNINAAIDEVTIFNSALTQAEVDTIRQQTYPCALVPAVDHFNIDHNGSAIYCAATPVTVTAEDVSNNTVTTYSGTITLDTGSSIGDWSLVTGAGSFDNGTANDGVASYTYTSADNGVAVFSLDHSDTDTTVALGLNIVVSDSGAVDDNAEGLLNYSASGFTITGSTLVNNPPSSINTNLPINTQVAGTNFDVFIAAYGQLPGDASCGVIESYSGSKNVSVAVTYNDPSSGTITPMLNSTPTIFTAGQGQISVKYKDVGDISLTVSDATFTGNSNNFVVQPARFDIQLVGNPSATNHTGNVFTTAGVDFPVTVYVRDAEGSLTPNYGNETAAESAALSHSLVAPSGGSSGTLTGSLSRLTVATYSGNYQWSEVGIISLTATVAGADANDYLNSGAVSTVLNPVGRFNPAYFNVAASLTNRTDSNTQAACNSTFSFMDEQLTIDFDISAHKAGGGVTTNYHGDYALLNGGLALGDNTGDAQDAINVVAQQGGNVYHPDNRLSGTGPSVLMLNGIALGLGFPVSVDRIAVAGSFNAEAALTGIEFVINPIDSDGVESNGAVAINMSPSQDFVSAGTTDIYFGRIVVENAYGPEIRPLPMWAHTEFCTAVNTAATPDSCTSWQDLSHNINPAEDECSTLLVSAPANTTVLDYWQGGAVYGTGLEALFFPFDALINRGGGGWRLNYTGTANSFQTLLPALGVSTVNNYHPYLLLRQGQASFGSYRGNDRIIYWRER